MTNEERDIGREIKSVDVSLDERSRLLAELAFEIPTGLLAENTKFRYPVNKRDFTFNRLMDGKAFQGAFNEQNLSLEMITPLNFELEAFTAQRCVLASDGKILLKLGEYKTLDNELHEYLQTKKYIQQKSDASAPENTQRILREKSRENQARIKRIADILQDLIDEADIYAAGQQLNRW